MPFEWSRLYGQLRNDLRTLDASQPLIQAKKSVCQSFVVDTQLIQKCGVQVIDMHGIPRDVITMIIRLPVLIARLKAAASNPCGETTTVMVAAMIRLG